MSTRKVIDIKNKDGEKVYAKGHALATYTSEGLSVEESLLLLKSRLDEMGDGGGDVTVESDPLFTASPAANITDEDIASWNNKSDFSGSYNNLTDKPVIPSIEGLVTTEQLAEKQDAITDLDEIRSDAKKGATAVQGVQINDSPITQPESGIINLEFKTINGQPIEGSGNIEITTEGGGITSESDPIFTASAAAGITADDIEAWNNKSDFSGSYEDLTDKPTIPAEQVNADWNATSGKAQILNKPTIPAAVTESTVSGWGFTKNTGTYSKPSDGIPRSDLASAVRTSLDKADTALQSYTEQYKGTVTGVRMNGTTKNPSSGVVDLGTVITAHQDLSGKQDKLISGTNIRTINGASILGSGDLTVGDGKEVVEAPVEYISGTYLILFATGMQAGKVYVAKHRVTGIQSLFFEEPLTDVADYTLHFTTGDVATLDPFVFPSHLLWANGVVPTITPDTSYELSVTATMLDDEYVYKAVLTHFKTV